MNPLRRLTERLRRARTGEREPRPAPTDGGLLPLIADVEQGLHDIDFEEVTTEDRITFVECAVAWHVRAALRAGRFDLAIRLQRFGAERAAQLYQIRHGWRPVLLYGVPESRPDPPAAAHILTNSASDSRFSSFTRSGVHPATTEPGLP
jgi:hypothetical protein